MLELDYLIEEISSSPVDITAPSDASYVANNVRKEFTTFDPSDTGTYIINVNGQTVEVEVVSIPDSTLTQDLVAWYRFEDGDARDYTNDLEATFADTTAYNGTVRGATHQSSGGITDVLSGANSGFLDLSNDSESIEYPDPPQLESATEFTIIGWAKPQTTDDVLIYGTERDDASNNTELRTQGVRVENGGNRAQVTSDAATQGSFNHFALVWNAPDVEYYINGNFQGTGSGPSQSTGSLDAHTGDYFSQSVDIGVDDIRVYNRALSSTEIGSIYNNTKP